MSSVLGVFKGEKPVEAFQVTDQAEWRKLWSAREVIAPYLMKANEGILVGAELVANLAETGMKKGFPFGGG